MTDPAKTLPTVVDLTFDHLTIGQLELLEEATGLPFGEMVVRLMQPDQLTAKLFLGLALLTLFPTNPQATIDDARNVHVSEINALADALTDAAQTTPRRRRTAS